MISETTRIGSVEVTLETGQIATLAGGSVVLRQGDTLILAAATAATHPKPVPFLPLTVEYREMLAAAGRIPGSYQRREGRLNDHEVLTSRLVDRTVRALFPKTWRCDTQLIINVMSYEPGTDPAALAIVAGAAALHISDIPWDGPAAGCRVSRCQGSLVAMASADERKAADIDLVVSMAGDGLIMVEGEADAVAEADVIAALTHAGEALAPVQEALDRLREKAGRPKRAAPPAPPTPESVALAVESIRDDVAKALSDTDRERRRDEIRRLRASALDGLQAEATSEEVKGLGDALQTALADLEHQLVRAMVLDSGRRLDGRPLDQVRDIQIQPGWLPRAHGSAVFTRGQTQAVVSCTLGAKRSSQEIETLDGPTRHPFMLHYSFPPYSVGEVRPLRGVGRREVGHGHLARRALAPVLPAPDAFPYTIRIFSEITQSNGSSSMASICGGSLALMNAGVPITAPVAGVAMGLVHDGERTAVLTDILGDEDHHGDMDFKVAGTADGITALQLDSKMGRVPGELLHRALSQAREARQHILGRMADAVPATRDQPAQHAPRATTLKIRPNRIRDLIGQGGKNIQGVSRDTGVQIDVNDDGAVAVWADANADLDAALARIEDLTGEPEVGGIYDGRVTGVKHFGAFVRLFEGVEGLVSAAQLERSNLESPNMGDTIRVKVRGVDERGRINLETSS